MRTIVLTPLPLKQGLKQKKDRISPAACWSLNASSIKTRIETKKLPVLNLLFYCGLNASSIKTRIETLSTHFPQLELGWVLTPLPLKQGLKPEILSTAMTCMSSLNASSIKTRIETVFKTDCQRGAGLS